MDNDEFSQRYARRLRGLLMRIGLEVFGVRTTSDDFRNPDEIGGYTKEQMRGATWPSDEVLLRILALVYRREPGADLRDLETQVKSWQRENDNERD